MQRIRDNLSVFEGESVLTIGNFDGIHQGHQSLIQHIKERAAALGVKSGMLTFDPHPMTVIRPQRAPLVLTTIREKEVLLEALGLDLLALITFTSQTMKTRAADFLQYLVDGLRPRELWIGQNFALGYRREGNLEFIRKWAEPRGIAIRPIPLIKKEGNVVSSSRIRALVIEGQVEEAARLLARPPSISGMVQMGDKRGRTIGFPTANIIPEATRVVPANGVYATRVILPNGESVASVTNIGVRPTFDGQQRQIESHLFEWSGHLYGKEIEVQFLHRLREEKKFNGIQELIAQIRRDAEEARKLLGLE